MHAEPMAALTVANAILSWETADGPLESHFHSGLLRWPEGDKARAELILNVICEDSVYDIKLRYSSAHNTFLGTWETAEGKGTADCQLYREEIGDDVELDGTWVENNRSLKWSGLLILDEATEDE